MKAPLAEGAGGLRWLDFSKQLLCPSDEGGLLPRYALDGIHLHPDYIDLLAPAFRKAEHTAGPRS